MIKKLTVLAFTLITLVVTNAQTPLEEAVNFHVKTIYGEPIWLFPLLDDENQIVVIDFFSTTCGPCQDYAPDFQACYEIFGNNEGNVYFMGINWGNDNQGVKEFDSIFGLTFPSASGSQGGGNIVFNDYEILSYPTVVVITPDHVITEQYVWPPDEQTITNAVIEAGGLVVNTSENRESDANINVYPIPAKNYTNVEFNLRHPGKVRISISNILGQEVFSSSSDYFMKGENRVNLPVTELKNGYYFITLITENQIIGTTRFSVSN